MRFRKCFRKKKKMKIDREPYSSVSARERDIHLKNKDRSRYLTVGGNGRFFILHGVSNFRAAKM